MRFDIMTLFPEAVSPMLNASILGRAQKKGLIEIHTHQIRDYTANRQNQVDDYPYGGGRGAIMQCDPLWRCWCAVCDEIGAPVHTIFLSPCGPAFDQAKARQLQSGCDNLILVCGHYEGIDQRFLDECVDEEISMGDAAPAECPVCHAKSNMFEEVKGDLTLAAEHEYGIYAKTVKNNPDIPEADKQYIFDQLKANFNGECSEVGMYLCMARIAHREGYPEIGLYWEKAAYEEAEHAAKFAEMLGEELEPNMKATTKDNLKWRVDCEFGATQGKFDLAKCAKKNNLDAIHDTVHEMAKDEARHGRALKGLLERYFK